MSAPLERLIRQIARENDLTFAGTKSIISDFIEAVKKETWEAGKFEVRNFATFSVRNVEARGFALNAKQVQQHRVVKIRPHPSWRKKTP